MVFPLLFEDLFEICDQVEFVSARFAIGKWFTLLLNIFHPLLNFFCIGLAEILTLFARYTILRAFDIFAY